MKIDLDIIYYLFYLYEIFKILPIKNLKSGYEEILIF